ncbi:DUF488 domain-containing protein [Atopobium sp. oral taxon 416]|nr:DUF488 domain-containing protein [Atopobium sp. oral taxon 416]
MLDVRLRNSNQLCGFTKQEDLEYFAETISRAHYVYDPIFASASELLDGYRKHELDWDGFKEGYLTVLQERDALQHFKDACSKYSSIALLGAGAKKRHSHTEILLELSGGKK